MNFTDICVCCASVIGPDVVPDTDILTTAAEMGYTVCMTITAEPLLKETNLATAEDAHAAFIKSLLAQGAIPFVPEGRSAPAPRPVPVRGEPVSETIVAERR